MLIFDEENSLSLIHTNSLSILQKGTKKIALENRLVISIKIQKEKRKIGKSNNSSKNSSFIKFAIKNFEWFALNLHTN